MTWSGRPALTLCLFLNPVYGLVDSFRSMSKYQLNRPILFGGRMVPAMDLPWHYPLEWLVVGSPLPTVLATLTGFGVIAADLLRRRTADLRPLLVAAAGSVPLVVIMVMGATLYNGLRHFLFVVPPLILTGAYAVVRAGRWIAAQRRGVLVAVLGTVGDPGDPGAGGLGDGADLSLRVHVLQPGRGQVRRCRTRYETDYWAVCTREAVWLAEQLAALHSCADRAAGLTPGALAQPVPATGHLARSGQGAGLRVLDDAGLPARSPAGLPRRPRGRRGRRPALPGEGTTRLGGLSTPPTAYM